MSDPIERIKELVRLELPDGLRLVAMTMRMRPGIGWTICCGRGRLNAIGRRLGPR